MEDNRKELEKSEKGTEETAEESKISEETENGEESERDERYKIPFIISLVVLIILLLLTSFYFAFRLGIFSENSPHVTEPLGEASGTDGTSLQDEQSEPVTDGTEDSGTAEPELPENPIDFSEQMSLNDEIYAWIYVPGTNVNYPILQSRTDDLYYLRRGVDKKYLLAGVVFTQSHNKRNFKDPVTLIYGHNMTEDGSMFATLHNFEDPTFFAEHDTVYIYTPGHILTYKIVSAYRYDKRHIMNSLNFDDEEVRRDYFDYVLNPTMLPMNVREGETLETDDKLIVLSTCMADNRYRYLVNAVLVSDQPTK